MSVLFDDFMMGGLRLRNRFVRSATGDGFADVNGHVSVREHQIFRDLAEGGVGLIITGIAFVHPSGRISDHQLSIASDDCIPGLHGLVRIAHDGGAPIVVQLFHSGREAADYLGSKGLRAIGPSYVKGDPYFDQDHAVMDADDFQEIIKAFGLAASRAKDAGFDGVQIHAAHGYLFSQLLSPSTNLRSDVWGGSLKNRIRFHLEVCREIRSHVGDDFPILAKIGLQDGFAGGLTMEEGLRAAEWLAQGGVDCLEISQGLRGEYYRETEYRTKIYRISEEAYFRGWSREVKRRVDKPVMLVGGLRSFELIEEIILSGDADLISLSRPLLREPDLIRRWRQGDRRKSACVSCNKCFESLIQGTGAQCVCLSDGKHEATQ